VFDHVTLHCADRGASERFYDLVLGTLGGGRTGHAELYTEWSDFSIATVDDEHPPTRGLHLGFVAPSRAHVDAFWGAGVEAGFADDGAPGPRPVYGPDYYGGFLLDPAGNSAEAVFHDSMRTGGVIDHLWIRVADVPASRDFYARIAPFAGLRLEADRPELARFAGSSGSFSVLADGRPVAENVHLAFPAGENATVDAFHTAAIAAGYRDNGVPGERAIYHPGYYGAFVLDPDGNNVEVVNHNRPA
jgi:catechol 2,3-dioxygenase-like lactoylglutathione lyase family enzyme